MKEPMKSLPDPNWAKTVKTPRHKSMCVREMREVLLIFRTTSHKGMKLNNNKIMQTSGSTVCGMITILLTGKTSVYCGVFGKSRTLDMHREALCKKQASIFLPSIYY